MRRIRIKRLWLNEDTMAPATELPTGDRRRIAGKRTGEHPRAREMIGKGEGVTAKLTRGLAMMEELGRMNGDDDRRRESTGDGELGTGSVGIQPKAAEIDPHSPVNMGEGSG